MPYKKSGQFRKGTIMRLNLRLSRTFPRGYFYIGIAKGGERFCQFKASSNQDLALFRKVAVWLTDAGIRPVEVDAPPKKFAPPTEN